MIVRDTDLLSNAGTFASPSGWTIDLAAWTYNAATGAMDKDADGTGALSKDTLAAVVGQVYQVTYTITNRTAGDVTAAFGGANGAINSTNGTYVDIITAVSAAGLSFVPSNTARFTIDNVIVRDVIASIVSSVSGKTVTNNGVTFVTEGANGSRKFGTHIASFPLAGTGHLSIPDHPDFDFSDGTWAGDMWIDPWYESGADYSLYYQETPVTKVVYDTGAHEPTVGEAVHQDSGATGIVLKYDNAGGWSGAGIGTIWLGSVTGTWNNAEAMHDAGAAVANCATCTLDKNFFHLRGYASGDLTANDSLTITLRAFGVSTDIVSATNLNFTSDSIHHHIEFNENGDQWRIFLDGHCVAAVTVAVTRPENYTSPVYIGFNNDTTYYYGYMDEFRVSKSAGHLADFVVPVAPYGAAGGSGSVGNLYVGSLRPIQGIKFYIQHANDTAATATVAYWNGTEWVDVASQNDATAADGKTLKVTGGASITFTSTVGLGKPIYLKGYFLYFYRVSFSGIDADTSIYQVTVDAPFQTVVDLWDGSPLLLSSCLRYLAATSSYKDFTLEVAEYTQEAFAEFDALATTEYILFGSPVPLTGFNLQVSTDAAKVNDNVATMTVAYCDGKSIANWPSVTGLFDETARDFKSIKQSGVVSFAPLPPRTEFKVSINGGEPQYYYKLSFSAALSAGVEVGYITGIPAPQTIKPYKFPFAFLGRAMLCGYLLGNEGNRVDYPMANSHSAWNGPDSSFGVDNASLYFGGSDQLTAACEVYNRLGSSIYSFAIFTKEYETYILNGYDPATYRIYPISSVHGCPAPETMDTYQVGISKDAQSVRSIAMWLSHSGPVMFDSGGLVPVPGLECYFDRRDSRCVNSAAIKSARGWFDPDTGDYNLQIPSGSGQTTNNVWVALSVTYKKWYCVVPSADTDPYLGAAFRVADTDGRQYVYGGRDNGYMMRIHNPAVATWDDIASVQSITLGDLLCTENVWEKVRLLFLKIFGISTTEALCASVTHYADGASSGTPLAEVALNATPRYFKNTQALNLLAWSHQIKISATISTEARGMRLLGWGLKYMIEREDL